MLKLLSAALHLLTSNLEVSRSLIASRRSLLTCALVLMSLSPAQPVLSQVFRTKAPVVLTTSYPELEDFLDQATLASMKGDGKRTAEIYQQALEWAQKNLVSDHLILEINLRAADNLQRMMRPHLSPDAMRMRNSYAHQAFVDLIQHPEKRKEFFLLAEPFYVNALALVQKDEKLKSYRGEVLECLADICHSKGDLAKEEELLIQATKEIKPKNSNRNVVLMQAAYVWLAELRIREGQPEKAEELLQQAIQICTVVQGPIYDQEMKLAELYLRLGKPELALPLYAKKVADDEAKHADDFWTVDHLVQYERALRLSGQVKEDQLVREQVETIERKNPSYFKNEAWAYSGPWRRWGHTFDEAEDPHDELKGLDI